MKAMLSSLPMQWFLVLCSPLTSAVLAGCGSEPAEPEAFSLRFAATVDGEEVGCADELDDFGPAAGDRVGIGDLRFYVSNLRLLDSDGRAVDFVLDANEFQYSSPAGAVALIDLTGNTAGSCASTSIDYAEGTARTNAVITGRTLVDHVVAVSFDIGVPQALMKETIAANTPEGAPSPLSEMYWSWNSGYRHFVFNFAVHDASGADGGGYLHIGSRDCGPPDGVALEDRERCTFVNTPAVAIDAFDLASDAVAVDLRRLLDGVDFRSPIYDPDTFEVIGEGPGVECHSGPAQPDCGPIFGAFGLDMSTGVASAAANTVFGRME